MGFSGSLRGHLACKNAPAALAFRMESIFLLRLSSGDILPSARPLHRRPAVLPPGHKCGDEAADRPEPAGIAGCLLCLRASSRYGRSQGCGILDLDGGFAVPARG